VWEFAGLDMARPLQDDLPLGERIAYWRRRRGMSQRVCAELVGRTEGWLSQIERGIRPLDRLSVLVELARVLRVDPGELTGAAIRQLTPNGHDHPAVAAIRAQLMRYDTVAGVASPPGTEEPQLRDLASLRRDAEHTWEIRQAARYDELGTMLPRLLAEVQLAVQQASDQDLQAALTIQVHVLNGAAALLRKFGDAESAWVAADRAMAAAARAEDPLLVAAAARRAANVFLAAGRLGEARDLALGAAAPLEEGLGAATPQHLAMWGGLLLTAVLAVSRQSDHSATYELLGEARIAGERLGRDVDNLYAVFGPTDVAIYDVQASVELGNPARAIRRAETVDTSGLAVGLLERRCHHLIDVARGHSQLRDDESAVATLLEAEQVAPQELKYNGLVRGTIREMLRRERRTIRPALRGLASRTGVLD